NRHIPEAPCFVHNLHSRANFRTDFPARRYPACDTASHLRSFLGQSPLDRMSRVVAEAHTPMLYNGALMRSFKTASVETNGIRMNLLEAGDGPLVILLHGFPELGYSWRHQLPAFAEAGYRVIAPDQRGYGKTDCPSATEEYTLCHLVADVVGLVHALGEKRACVLGHDWGSGVAWTCALLRPDIFQAVGLLSVPYVSNFWSGPRSTVLFNELLAGGQMLYQFYFQEPGKADHDFAQDPRSSIL